MENFNKMLSLVLLSEVGPNFDCEDTETKAGLCSTPRQKRKTGYNKVRGDKGGATKFGIASASHPHVNVSKMTYDEACQIYHKDYFIPVKCDEMTYELGLVVFDCAVNSGIGKAVKTLQRVLHLPEDGKMGPHTLAKLKEADQKQLASDFLDTREQFYRAVVKNKPSQKRFIKGWLARVNFLRQQIA